MSEKLRAATQTIGLLLVSVWLGAAIFFSAVVAPSVFGVLRGFQLPNANEIAGAIVTRSLSAINGCGFVISIPVLIAGLFLKPAKNRPRFFAGVISLAIMGIMTALGQWVISARMLSLRTAMQVPIDQIAREDPRRVAFDSLHHYSVAALGIAIIAALVAFVAFSRPKGLSD